MIVKELDLAKPIYFQTAKNGRLLSVLASLITF